MQAMKQLQAIEAGPNPPPPGTVFPSEPEGATQSSETVIVPYAETNLLIRNNPTPGSQIQLLRKAPTMPKPKWHPPWKLFRVIAGHLGWVRCVAVEPGNEVDYRFIRVSHNYTVNRKRDIKKLHCQP